MNKNVGIILPRSKYRYTNTRQVIWLEPGFYIKVTSRAGTAGFRVHDDGSLSYVNRRGEVGSCTPYRVVSLYRDGYTTRT